MKEVIKTIFEEIEKEQNIIISRHCRPDGDAVGSTLGLAEILRLTYPEKNIKVVNKDYSEYVKFLGTEDEKPENLEDYMCIVIDTATDDRISDPDVLKCKKIIKIDHHVDVKPYGDISWVEEDCPAASEMVAYFWYENRDKLKMNSHAATCLYTGINTDTGRFKFGANSKTFNIAGILLDYGIDTQMLYARLELEDFNFYKFQSHVFEKMNISENGVAYLYVDNGMQKEFNLSKEQASESVSFMNAIKGSLIWIAFIDNPDGTIRVRLRSRFLAVNKLAEKYRGGGHAMASGATVYNQDEMKALISDADALLKEYKENNKDWI